MMNDELKTKKEKERTTLFQTSVVLATPLSFIQTSRYFEDFLVVAHGRASFLISNMSL